MKNENKIFSVCILVILFLVVYAYIFGILLNYENAWMHPELIRSTGNFFWDHLTLADRWEQMFNWRLWEGDYEGRPGARARLFSHIMITANALFRNWLFHYVPPHPSLSLTWIFTLFLGPYFLYRFMQNLTHTKETGLITSLVSLALPGTLIPITMLFHAGKPMSNFLYILCLYLGSILYRDLNKLSDTIFLRKALLLFSVIFLSFFFDEYCLFIWILIPIFYPRLFASRFRGRICLLYGVLPLLYFLSLGFFLPAFYSFVGYPGFDIRGYIDIDKGIPWPNLFYTTINFVLALHDNLQAGFNVYLKDPSLTVEPAHFLSVSNQLKNADNIRLGLTVLNEKTIFFWQIIHNILTLIIIVIFLLALRQAKDKETGPLYSYFLKSTLALGAYTLFFSYLHLANNIVSGCGWYECNFSILFAIWLGLALHLVGKTFPESKIVIYLFIFSLIMNTLWNTRLLNLAWMAMHWREKIVQCDIWLNKKPRLGIYKKYFLDKRAVNFETTREAWKLRKEPARAEQVLQHNGRPEICYLYSELPFIK